MTQLEALKILKTGANVFLTGEPGSGKTHIINEYVAFLRDQGIEPAITASTGIAATHIGGMTIHSWSGIGIKKKLDKYDLDRITSNEYITKRVRRAKILIIDEVSMLPPETLSMVDAVCREIKQNDESFGGLQVVLVGDFFQLPPVVKRETLEEQEMQMSFIEVKKNRFAYDSLVWPKLNPVVCYLAEQYRQDDPDFLAVLGAIRCNKFGAQYFCHIEKRKIEPNLAPDNAPKLFSHNVDVDYVNNEKLLKLPGKLEEFIMISQGNENLIAALKKGCLSPETLLLKVDASVMFTKNSPKDGFVNGTLGRVAHFDKHSGFPVIQTKNGKYIEVEPMDWTVEENGKVRARITQIPLRLAWAITVHKSQGMSLDEAVMDLSDVFEYGQGYVALSRVRRLSGLYILGWNDRAFQVSPEVLAKDAIFRSASDNAREAFAKIPTDELENMRENFVVACGGRITKAKKQKSTKARVSNDVTRRTTFSTLGETLALFKEGKSIKEISKIRDLKEQTIWNHIEELSKKGKINHADLFSLLTPLLVRSLPKIHEAFRDFGTEKLTPVFEKLSGKYSYDDLRIARMLLK